MTAALSEVGAAPSRRVMQLLLVLFGFWFVLVVVLGNADSVFGGGAAPASTSSTSSSGYAALGSLLNENHDRVHLSSVSSLPAAGTLVIADTALSRSAARAIETFARDGGRVVLLGDDAIETIRMVAGPQVNWTSTGVTLATASGHPLGRHAVRSVASDGAGAFTNVGRANVLLAASSHVLAAQIALGRGEVTFIADSSVFANDHLAEADNAAFALDIAGSPPSSVTFVPTGTSDASGLGALPGDWRWAAALLVIAWGAWAWSAGRRFGPPDGEDDRLVAPARRTYIDSLATLLTRARDPAPSGRELRRLIGLRLQGQREALPVGPPEVRELARRAGLDEEEIAMLDVPVETEAQLLTLTRLAQQLETGQRRSPGDQMPNGQALATGELLATDQQTATDR